jgi:hypothetical protein
VGLAGTNSVYSGEAMGTNVDRSGVQWLRLNLDPNSGLLSYGAHGRVYDDASLTNAYWYYVPSLAVNCTGDMVMGFSGSSATNYIGAFYSWRLSSGSSVRPRLIRDGTVSFTAGRWGDYSATTLDPNDDWSFWTVQEFADPAGDPDGVGFPWLTVVAKLRPQP